MSRLTTAGHRVVHGGDTFAGPVRINNNAIEAIDTLTMFAPLRQSLRLIRPILRVRH